LNPLEQSYEDNTEGVFQRFPVKYRIFHFGGISSISPSYFYESLTVISQKIENVFLYRTVYKDIFSMLSQTLKFLIYEVENYSKIESSDSILIKRVSRKVNAIFLTPDFERALKTASNGVYHMFITD